MSPVAAKVSLPHSAPPNLTENGEVLYSGRMIETVGYNRCVENQKLMPTITVGPVLPNDWTMEEYMHLGLFDMNFRCCTILLG